MIVRTKSRVTTVETILRTELSPEERRRLVEMDMHLHFPTGPKADHLQFLKLASRWWHQSAPSRVVDEIARWHLNPDRPGVIMFDGLGVDRDLPPTPTDGRRSGDKLTTYSEKILAGVGGMLGQPIGFLNERHGSLIADLTPVKGKESALTNEGAGRLGWHTEHNATGFLVTPPTRVIDYLVFFHLREDPRGEAKTLVADVRDALNWISPEAVETLWEPNFLFRPPFQVRASLPPNRQEVRGVSILSGSPDNPYVNGALYGDLTEGLTERDQRALAEFRLALDAVQRQVPTVPGRLVLIDNRRVLHSRFPFRPNYDGRDRWLQRLMVTTSLEPFRNWQTESPRILSPGG
jgi:L-asparagine oxygenase